MLGTDVAYYHPALRPLMDAISAHLDPEGGLMLVAGQANRGQQMQLRKNIRDGCYNQLTDEREPPWPGASTMLLYELAQRPWESVGVGNEEGRGGEVEGEEEGEVEGEAEGEEGSTANRGGSVAIDDIWAVDMSGALVCGCDRSKCADAYGQDCCAHATWGEEPACEWGFVAYCAGELYVAGITPLTDCCPFHCCEATEDEDGGSVVQSPSPPPPPSPPPRPPKTSANEVSSWSELVQAKVSPPPHFYMHMSHMLFPPCITGCVSSQFDTSRASRRRAMLAAQVSSLSSPRARTTSIVRF